MARSKGRAKRSTTSHLMTEADRCITTLAQLYAANEITFNKEQAKRRLELADEDLTPVLRILEALGVITAEEAAGEPYDHITIQARAVALAHKDLVEHWLSRFRRRPAFAALIAAVVVLTALVAAANQAFTLVGNLHPAANNPPSTVTYQGYTSDYWTDQLNDLDSGTARKASNAAYRLRADAVPGLIRALHSKNPFTVELAVRTLGNIGQGASGAVTELEQLGLTQPALKSLVDQALGQIRKQ